MIVVVGFMGAGKTSAGRKLAAALGLPFDDSDQVIEARAGRAIAQIFAEDGEPAFRALEAQVIAELVAGPPMVLALGGGAVENPDTRAALRAATVVHVSVSFQQAMARVGGDARRPMLGRPDIAEVYARRQPLYSAVADIEVLTDGRQLGEVVERIRAALPPSAGA
jgi:shikimate kinase